jgi:LTXXQ motif family protein
MAKAVDMPAGRRCNAAGAACRAHQAARTMLQAFKLVQPALEDFYAMLSDEQKAQFEAIGPKWT